MYKDTRGNGDTPLMWMVKELGLNENLFFEIRGQVKTDEPRGSWDNPKNMFFTPQDPGYLMGVNNDTYAFSYRQTMIITRDKESAEKLREAYTFNEKDWNNRPLAVPFSNGERVAEDSVRYADFLEMEETCRNKKEYIQAKERTKAIQRGPLITTYDPNRIDAANEYVNVAHYKQSKSGDYVRVTKSEAASLLQEAGYIKNRNIMQTAVTKDMTQSNDARFKAFAMRKGNDIGGL